MLRKIEMPSENYKFPRINIVVVVFRESYLNKEYLVCCAKPVYTPLLILESVKYYELKTMKRVEEVKKNIENYVKSKFPETNPDLIEVYALLTKDISWSQELYKELYDPECHGGTSYYNEDFESRDFHILIDKFDLIRNDLRLE